jgi:hypothetical protein
VTGTCAVLFGGRSPRGFHPMLDRHDEDAVVVLVVGHFLSEGKQEGKTAPSIFLAVMGKPASSAVVSSLASLGLRVVEDVREQQQSKPERALEVKELVSVLPARATVHIALWTRTDRLERKYSLKRAATGWFISDWQSL